jgi:hypothetical protein
MLFKGQDKVLSSYRRNQSSTNMKESSGTNARHRVIVNIFYETVELFAMFGQMPKKFVYSASELQCLKEERDVMKQNQQLRGRYTSLDILSAALVMTSK